MESIEYAINEFNKVDAIANSLISSLKAIKIANEIHSKSIDQRIQELKNKGEKLPLSHIEKIILEILQNEKEGCEIKASFLKCTCIRSLEEICERNKKDFEFFKLKGKIFINENKLISDQIEKLKKTKDGSLSNYFKIQSLCNKRKELYNSKESSYDEFFSGVAGGINSSFNSINQDIQRYAAFTLQLKTKAIDYLNVFYEIGEDCKLNENLMRNKIVEELNSHKEKKMSFIHKEKVEIKSFLGSWKQGTIFVFPAILIIAMVGKENEEIEFLTDFREEMKMREIELVGMEMEKKSEKRLNLIKKKKNLLETIFGFDTIEMRFRNESDLETFKKKTAV